MRRRWMGLVAAGAVAALAVAGCSSSTSSDGSSSTPNTPAQTGGQSAAAPTGEASGGGTFNLGVITSCSGIYAVQCSPTKDGVQYWLKEHGNKLAGRTVKLSVVDDKSTTQGAVSAANDLVQQKKVSAVVGLVNSAGALAARTTLMNNKIITISTVANATDLLDTKKGPYMFLVTAPSNETGAAAALMAKNQGWNDIAGIADNYSGARDWLDPALDAAQKLGLVVKDRLYPPFPTSDYGPYVSKLATKSPKLVMPVMFGPSANAFLKAYSSFGGKAQVYTTGSMIEPVSQSADLLKLATGAYAYWNYSPYLPGQENESFVKGFEAAYGHAPGAFEMQGYVALELLDKAYTTAGPNASPDTVREALQKAEVASPVGQVSLGTGQAIDWNIYLMKVADGPDGKLGLVPVGPYVKNTHPGMTVDEAQSALAQLPTNGG